MRCLFCQRVANPTNLRGALASSRARAYGPVSVMIAPLQPAAKKCSMGGTDSGASKSRSSCFPKCVGASKTGACALVRRKYRIASRTRSL